MFRTLIHHGRLHLAVAAGAAVATAVITGALVVGDSVRGSLRALTLERLGGVEHAVTAQRFVGEDLAARLAAQPAVGADATVAPAILLRGGVEHATRRTRAAGVGIQGVDARFLDFFDAAATTQDGRAVAAVLAAGADASSTGGRPPALISAALAEELGAAPGDEILLHLARWSQIPRSSLLGRSSTDDVVETVRLEVAGLLPARGLGRFGLAVTQRTSHNVFLPLAALQRLLDRRDKVNALLVGRAGDAAGADDPDAQARADALDDALRSALTLDDLGLRVTRDGDVATLESDAFLLRPELVAIARAAADDAELASQPLLTYLANRIAAAAPDGGADAA
ncbi:MAG: ABC transporter permease, partial [Acidobacteriota bacterium]